MQTLEIDVTQPAGSALVTNTMIGEASRFLARDFSRADIQEPPDYDRYESWARNYAYPLIDLCSLIDAVILHDQLYTVPCTMNAETAKLELRKSLIGAGIVQELDTSARRQAIADLILHGLAQIENVQAVSEGYVDFEAGVKTEIANILHGPEDVDDPELALSGPELGPRSFEDVGRTVIADIEYSGSGSYEEGTSLLRDMYYVYAAEAFRLPYWPQMGRIEFAKHFPNRFDKDTRTALYQKMADALKATVAEVAADFEESIAYIPPFASLVLKRSRTPADIIVRMFELREETRHLRERLTQLDNERLAAASLAQRSSLIQKRRELLAQMGKAFERTDSVRFQNIIRYIPDLIRPALNPMDPTKYSANLLLQPVEWILSWWRKRPVAMFLDVSGRVAKMPDYKDLVAKVFGPAMGKVAAQSELFAERFKSETLKAAATATS
jgi:hypothetical protein